MDTWNIAAARDDALGIADVVEEISSLATELISALEIGNRSVPVWELWHESPSVGRATVQIPVTVEFFERFFNSPNGYRAMFRRGRRVGSAANAALIDPLVSLLGRTLPESIDAVLVKKVGDVLNIAGRQGISRSTFLRSLDPSLAKVWYATQEISSESIRWLSSGVSGNSKIDVGLEYAWNKIEQGPGDCLIEVKGAFVGSCGLFQVKDPELRATGLSTTGAA
ncbi:MAG: hypothetical protein AB1452_14045 [Pseudomonadota bacterium]